MTSLWFPTYKDQLLIFDDIFGDEERTIEILRGVLGTNKLFFDFCSLGLEKKLNLCVLIETPEVSKLLSVIIFFFLIKIV